MKGQDERTLGGGLGAAIFVMPLVFGWLTLRRGYHPGVRIVVAIYMALSLIPLYFLASLLWNSGDEVKRLARDYDKNRAVADRNAGGAQGYMDEYERAGEDAPATATPGTPLDVTAAGLASQIEKDKGMVARLSGRAIRITGTMSGAPQGNRVFLAGGELYPAVILDYAATPPTEGQVSATCTGIRLDTIGPILGGCQ